MIIKSIRRMVIERRSTYSVGCFPSKWSDNRSASSALPTDSHTRADNKRWQWQIWSGPSLMSVRVFHMYNPVYDNSLSLGLRVCFISSHLTVDKLFPVNPRVIIGPPKVSLLHEPKSIPALIIKQWLILVLHKDDLKGDRPGKKSVKEKITCVC